MSDAPSTIAFIRICYLGCQGCLIYGNIGALIGQLYLELSTQGLDNVINSLICAPFFAMSIAHGS